MDGHGPTGVILAGGSSRRLGTNKALVRVGGQTLIQRVVDALEPLVSEVIAVVSDPSSLSFAGLRCVSDLHADAGALGGLHAGLSAMNAEHALVVGCDMPFLSTPLLRHLLSLRFGFDVVMPKVGCYYEPLHAVYSRRCLPTLGAKIAAGERRIHSACEGLRTCYVEQTSIAKLDPSGLSFFNVNTPGDLERMRALIEAPRLPGRI